MPTREWPDLPDVDIPIKKKNPWERPDSEWPDPDPWEQLPPWSPEFPELPEGYLDFAERFMRLIFALATHRAAMGDYPSWPWFDLRSALWADAGLINIVIQWFRIMWSTHRHHGGEGGSFVLNDECFYQHSHAIKVPPSNSTTFAEQFNYVKAEGNSGRSAMAFAYTASDNTVAQTVVNCTNEDGTYGIDFTIKFHDSASGTIDGMLYDFLPNTWYVVDCRVRDNAVHVYVNGSFVKSIDMVAITPTVKVTKWRHHTQAAVSTFEPDVTEREVTLYADAFVYTGTELILRSYDTHTPDGAYVGAGGESHNASGLTASTLPSPLVLSDDTGEAGPWVPLPQFLFSDLSVGSIRSAISWLSICESIIYPHID